MRHPAALAVAVLALAAGCGSQTEPTVAEARKAIEERLLGKKLSFKWVYCLRTVLEYGGSTIFRCNVNFGEPHIVIYCAIFDGGELVTNREVAEIRCGRNATDL